MKIKAVAADIDGTLTDEKQKISLEAIKHIRILEEKNIPVILVSGSTLCVLKTLQRYIGCCGALIAENGAVVEYKDKLKILCKRDEAEKALKELKRKYGDLIIEHWSNSYRYGDVVIEKIRDKSKVLNVIKQFPNLKLLDSGFALHITEKKVNKGRGLNVAVQLMDCKLQEIAAIGDSDTDIELLNAVSLKFAVANASPRLKSLSNHVTNKEGGEGFTEAVKIILSHI